MGGGEGDPMYDMYYDDRMGAGYADDRGLGDDEEDFESDDGLFFD
jgi:hypothetical protein